MFDSSWLVPRLLVLTLAVSLGCGERETAPPAPAAEAGEEDVPRFDLVVAAENGDFRARGNIPQGELFSVVDDNGDGLGFRPIGVEERGGVQLVALEVVRLQHAGTEERSEETLSRLMVAEGGTGSVDPGDGDGKLNVQVSSAQAATP